LTRTSCLTCSSAANRTIPPATTSSSWLGGGSIAAAVASQTVANCFYIYRKAVLSFVRDDLLETLDVAAGDAQQVKTCLNLGIRDSEDALQIAAAMDWKASFIITGNVRDFKRSPIPALAPAAWIKRFEPDLGK
jgi:hypothetical protein